MFSGKKGQNKKKKTKEEEEEEEEKKKKKKKKKKKEKKEKGGEGEGEGGEGEEEEEEGGGGGEGEEEEEGGEEEEGEEEEEGGEEEEEEGEEGEEEEKEEEEEGEGEGEEKEEEEEEEEEEEKENMKCRQGPRFELGDFCVKLGSVSISQNFKAVLVEVEYRPCVIPGNCWELIKEFLQGFLGSCVQALPPPYLQARINDVYTPVDTVQQYLEHFIMSTNIIYIRNMVSITPRYLSMITSIGRRY
ncbi:hypothetical protein M8J75_005881 [Diaphorina citri]|nr:hypothetical protein M8J75_005881 [Diaphorina citri]